MINMYFRLAAMAVLSFIAMYLLMYMMVDMYDDVFFNFNQFYMAAIMTAPMVVIELLLMGEMYKKQDRERRRSCCLGRRACFRFFFYPMADGHFRHAIS